MWIRLALKARESLEKFLQSMRMVSSLYSLLFVSAGFALSIDYLRAQSGASAVLSLEISTNSLSNWSAVPVAPNMIDTSGRLVSGSVSVGTNTFYRMRIAPTPANTFRGVYMGTHTNVQGAPPFRGEFATIVRSDNTATLVVTDSTSPGSMMAPRFSISADGNFSAIMTDDLIRFEGTVHSNGNIDGSIFIKGNPNRIGTIQGQRKPNTGTHANRDGLWNLGWGVTNVSGNFVGVATAIAAADGAYVAFIAGEGILRDGVSGQFQTNGAINNTSVRGTIVSAQAVSNATAALEGTLTMSNATRGNLIGTLVEPN